MRRTLAVIIVIAAAATTVAADPGPKQADGRAVTANPIWRQVCFQSPIADANGDLWILDGENLVEIDVLTGRPARTIAAVAPAGTRLQIAPDGHTAYLAGARGPIVVVDLATGKARRVHPSPPPIQPARTGRRRADGLRG